MEGAADRIRAIYAAFRRGDVDGILARLDPGVVWEHNWQIDPPEAYRPRCGREDVRGFFAALGAVEFLRFEPRGFLTDGTMVAVPIDIEIRSRRTGRTLRDLELHLWQLGPDGLVRRHRTYVDAKALEAIGRD